MKKIVVFCGMLIILFSAIFLLKNVALKKDEKNNRYHTDSLPTLSKLEKQYGSKMTDEGDCLIETGYYNAPPHAILLNKHKESLNVSIKDVKENQKGVTFIITSLKTIHPKKKIGDRIKVVLIDSKKEYVEYK